MRVGLTRLPASSAKIALSIIKKHNFKNACPYVSAIAVASSCRDGAGTNRSYMWLSSLQYRGKALAEYSLPSMFQSAMLFRSSANLFRKDSGSAVMMAVINRDIWSKEFGRDRLALGFCWNISSGLREYAEGTKLVLLRVAFGSFAFTSLGMGALASVLEVKVGLGSLCEVSFGATSSSGKLRPVSSDMSAIVFGFAFVYRGDVNEVGEGVKLEYRAPPAKDGADGCLLYDKRGELKSSCDCRVVSLMSSSVADFFPASKLSGLFIFTIFVLVGAILVG